MGRLARLFQHPHLLPAGAGVQPDKLVPGIGRLAVAGDSADRHLQRDGADVEAAEAVDAERVDRVDVLRGREQGQEAAQVQGVEDRAEIDVEGFGPLPGEHADAVGVVRIDPLGSQRGVVRYRGRPHVGRDRHQGTAAEQLGPLLVTDLGHGVGLAPCQPLRSGTIERRDPLQRGHADVRVAQIGQRRGQPAGAADGTGLGLEAELVDDILGLAVLVVVDVEPVRHLVVEVEVVRPVGGVLAGDDIHDERHAPVRRAAGEVGRVVADERVHVGEVGGGVERHQRRLAMAGGPTDAEPGPGECSDQQERESRTKASTHRSSPVSLPRGRPLGVVDELSAILPHLPSTPARRHLDLLTGPRDACY